MKICIISPGVVHAIPRTAAIADKFDEVDFIDATGKSDTAQLESHSVKYHGPGTPKGVISRRKLKRLFRTIEPDIIICHFASGDHFFDAIAYGNSPVAVIAMGQDVLYEAGDRYVPYLKRLLTRMALHRAMFISAKSEYLKNRIRQFGVKIPIEVNYWGADMKHFSPGNKDKARRKLGWNEEGIYILSPRAIEPRLNIDVIVDAFFKVLGKYPDSILVILGRADPIYLRQINEQISRLGISDNVMLQDEITQEMLPTYYRASDMVLSMARSEGFPNTILEVMACRIPVVIGKISQIEELLEDNKNALICEIDPHAISQKILDVLNNGASEAITTEAFHLVQTYANIKTNGEKFSSQLKMRIISDKKVSYVGLLLFKCIYLFHRASRKILGK